MSKKSESLEDSLLNQERFSKTQILELLNE